MAFTNETKFYGLPDWVGTDKPTFLTDFNNAFETIDNGMQQNKTAAAQAKTIAESAVDMSTNNTEAIHTNAQAISALTAGLAETNANVSAITPPTSPIIATAYDETEPHNKVSISELYYTNTHSFLYFYCSDTAITVKTKKSDETSVPYNYLLLFPSSQFTTVIPKLRYVNYGLGYIQGSNVPISFVIRMGDNGLYVYNSNLNVGDAVVMPTHLFISYDKGFLAT